MSGFLATADPTTAPGYVDTVTGSLSNVIPVLVAVAGIGLGIAATPFIVKRGWALIKGLRG